MLQKSRREKLILTGHIFFYLDKKCITEHEDFHSIMLLKNSLWTSLVQLHDTASRGLTNRNNVANKTYRYAAYRNFCWFVHTNLGKGVRRVIPSCVVKLIRQTFPSIDGEYVGFKEGIEKSEIEMSWTTG
jgi:P2X purinoceptor 7